MRADTWTYKPTVRGLASPFGGGCSGSAGVPTLSASGPAIIGNRTFALQMNSLRANAPAFLALSAGVALNQVFGNCNVYPQLPFAITIPLLSTPAGTVSLPFPIPLDPTLSGATVYIQGGASDSNGALFGVSSLTPGLLLRIGD